MDVDTLIGLVENQGGTALPDACMGVPLPAALGRRYNTCGCGELRLVVNHYSPESARSGPGFVTACIDCDAVGDWPRYAKEPV